MNTDLIFPFRRSRRLAPSLTVLFLILVAMLGIGASGASATTPPLAAAISASSARASAGDVRMAVAPLARDTPPSSLNADQATVCTTSESGPSNLLPIDRWSGSTSEFHTRLDAKFWSDLSQKAQRQGVFYFMMSIGNGLWKMAAGLTDFSARFCLLDTMGSAADHASATLGHAIQNSVLLDFLVVVGLLILLFRMMKNRDVGLLKRVMRLVLMLGLFIVMVAGADATGPSTTVVTNQGLPPGVTDNVTRQVFGFGSPAWFATRINGGVSLLASTPAQALSKITALGSSAPAKDNPDPLSCQRYVNSLKDDYVASFKNKAAASVPLSMSAMWENSGEAAWIGIQFGAANPFGPRTYCRYLETAGTHIPNQQILDRTKAAAGKDFPPNANPNSVAWTDLYQGKVADEGAIAWAACDYRNGAWQVVGGNGAVDAGGGNDWSAVQSDTDGGKITKDVCADWWKADAGHLKNGKNMGQSESVFNWEGGTDAISGSENVGPGASGQSNVEEFLMNWQGFANSSAFSLALAFMLCAIVMFVIFAGMALAVIIGVVAQIIMIIMAFPVMLTAFWAPGDSSRFGKFVKFYLGLTIFTFGVTIIYGLISLISGTIAQVGASAFGPGTVLAVLWSGFSPIAAVIVLHLLFTKALKMPSPFTPSGAMAYGGAISKAGGAVSGGLNRMTGGRIAALSGAVGGAVGLGIGRLVPEKARHSRIGRSMGLAGRAGRAGRRGGMGDRLAHQRPSAAGPVASPSSSGSTPASGSTSAPGSASGTSAHAETTAGSAPMKPKADSGTPSTESDATPAKSRATPVKSGTTPVKSDTTSGSATPEPLSAVIPDAKTVSRVRRKGGEKYATSNVLVRNTAGRARGARQAAGANLSELAARSRVRAGHAWANASRNPIRRSLIAAGTVGGALALSPLAVPFAIGGLAATHLARRHSRKSTQARNYQKDTRRVAAAERRANRGDQDTLEARMARAQVSTRERARARERVQQRAAERRQPTPMERVTKSPAAPVRGQSAPTLMASVAEPPAATVSVPPAPEPTSQPDTSAPHFGPPRREPAATGTTRTTISGPAGTPVRVSPAVSAAAAHALSSRTRRSPHSARPKAPVNAADLEARAEAMTAVRAAKHRIDGRERDRGAHTRNGSHPTAATRVRTVTPITRPTAPPIAPATPPSTPPTTQAAPKENS